MLATRPWGGIGGGADIAQVFERNQEATLYVGNIDNQVDEDLLWELFTQAGIVRIVNVPRDKVTGAHQGYAFVEFESETDADFALKLMGMVKVYGKPLRISKAAHDRRTFDVGANLFVGNLDPDLDEKVLFDTFSSFGNVVSAKVMRDPETGLSKGFAFVSMETFEASDAALAAMNGQFLCNRPVHVSYAYKKDTRGERHGSAAERLLAANRPAVERPGAASGVKEGPVPLQQQTTGAPPFGMMPPMAGGAPLPPLPIPMMGSGPPGSLPPPPLFFMGRPGMSFPPLPLPPNMARAGPPGEPRGPPMGPPPPMGAMGAPGDPQQGGAPMPMGGGGMGVLPGQGGPPAMRPPAMGPPSSMGSMRGAPPMPFPGMGAGPPPGMGAPPPAGSSPGGPQRAPLPVPGMPANVMRPPAVLPAPTPPPPQQQ
ncbi:hypothetical protein Efla_000132 [Eimeria flavescens]